MKQFGVVDILGNRFREGQLVSIKIGTEVMLGQVVQVEPPAVLESPGGATLPTVGKLVVQLILPIEVQSGVPVSGIWVLQQPKEENIQ